MNDVGHEAVDSLDIFKEDSQDGGGLGEATHTHRQDVEGKRKVVDKHEQGLDCTDAWGIRKLKVKEDIPEFLAFLGDKDSVDHATFYTR
jgi:hypothetical protein